MIDKENGGGNENGSLVRSITFRNTVLTPELIAAISHNSDASPTSIKSVDCIFCDLQYDGNMNTVLDFSNVQHLESLKLDMHRNLYFRRCVYVRFELSNGTLLCYRCDMMSDEERQQWRQSIGRPLSHWEKHHFYKFVANTTTNMYNHTTSKNTTIITIKCGSSIGKFTLEGIYGTYKSRYIHTLSLAFTNEEKGYVMARQ